jgi:hypothetical protein
VFVLCVWLQRLAHTLTQMQHAVSHSELAAAKILALEGKAKALEESVKAGK